MEAARSALFPLAIGSTSVRIKKNMSNIRQIKDRGRSCDDDQLKKFDWSSHNFDVDPILN